MTAPHLLAALLLFLAVALAATGAHAFFARRRRYLDRVRLEDALKHLHACEYEGKQCTLPSLSGAMGVRQNITARVTRELLAQDLATATGHSFGLTSKGRAYARRVLRAHRLFERFLSDRTGREATEWHAIADRREHQMKSDEVERLARRMGYPAFDPHGDPIPNAAGDIASPRGRPLTDLDEGQTATVVHLEDEPASLYRELLSSGLELGLKLRVLHKGATEVTIEANGHTLKLSPVLGANVAVVEASASGINGSGRSLADLRPGEKGAVEKLSADCRGLQRRRLMDLGLLPGTIVEPELRAAGGGLTAYRIRGTLVALRPEQASQIRVQSAPMEHTR